MRANAVLHPLLLALLAWPLAAASGGNVVDRICVAESAIAPRFKNPPIPVGCELIDCCPGCPGPGPVEWRVNVDARVLEGADLRFGGMGAAELKLLKIRGNAKLDGDRIVLGRGQSRIGGIPDRVAGNVTVGSLVPMVGKQSVTQLAGSARDRITVRQFLGSFPVNTFNWRFAFRPCDLPTKPPKLPDRLKVDGLAAGESVVVMLDARTSPKPPPIKPGVQGASLIGCTNDRIFSAGSLRFLGNLRAAAGCNSEIAIFSETHRMVLDTPVSTWTDAIGDQHNVTLQPLIDVPVSVWIADGTSSARAGDEVNNANLLFVRNRVGIRLVPTYNNVTNTNEVRTIDNGIAFAPNGDYFCTDAIDVLKASALFTANTLNVYYVTLGIYGRNCAIKTTPAGCPGTGTPKGDGNITYIGSEINLSTLPHELGHAFGLRPGPCGGHTDPGGVNLPGFEDDNIMRVAGDDLADHFSLGQVFRMNTHDDEWDGTMLIKNGLRPGPGRKCPPSSSWSRRCPALAADWP